VHTAQRHRIFRASNTIDAIPCWDLTIIFTLYTDTDIGRRQYLI